MRTEDADSTGSRDGRARSGPRKRRVPGRMSAVRLERIAVAHLQRHASSVENLRGLMRRRIAKRCEVNGQDPTEFEAPLAELLARFERAGLLDDRRYAESLARRGRARGASRREIAAKLRHKGVPAELVSAVIEGEAGEASEAEAAWRYARRRRLGPYRDDPELRRERRDRDLAALGRRGFGFATASGVIDAELDDAPFLG